jgi:hypothetical protein
MGFKIAITSGNNGYYCWREMRSANFFYTLSKSVCIFQIWMSEYLLSNNHRLSLDVIHKIRDPSSQKHFNLWTSQRVISESFCSPAARMPLVKACQYLPSLRPRTFDASKVDTGKFLYEVREVFLKCTLTARLILCYYT